MQRGLRCRCLHHHTQRRAASQAPTPRAADAVEQLGVLVLWLECLCSFGRLGSFGEGADGGGLSRLCASQAGTGGGGASQARAIGAVPSPSSAASSLLYRHST